MSTQVGTPTETNNLSIALKVLGSGPFTKITRTGERGDGRRTLLTGLDLLLEVTSYYKCSSSRFRVRLGSVRGRWTCRNDDPNNFD